ncbi:hypothetical protein [Endozoicomonas arenosclerae]|uniref:hypothetical protein n=1 Tax=Endozoicomonas arenosclerae TaxID=1633495 RepID=UPI000A6E46A4|nr:hypothetical protein [Endozoicomonas arenosclerae]
MPDLVRTLMIITGIIVVLFMLLVGFNVWAFTNVPSRLASPPGKVAMESPAVSTFNVCSHPFKLPS